MMRWNVHDEHVADAAARSKARISLGHGAEQLVGMKASLHQQFGFSGANDFDGFFRGGLAMRHID